MVKAKKNEKQNTSSRLDVPSCLKEDFELIIDDIFTIMGVGTVATGNTINRDVQRRGKCMYL